MIRTMINTTGALETLATYKGDFAFLNSTTKPNSSVTWVGVEEQPQTSQKEELLRDYQALQRFKDHGILQEEIDKLFMLVHGSVSYHILKRASFLPIVGMEDESIVRGGFLPATEIERSAIRFRESFPPDSPKYRNQEKDGYSR